MKKLIVIALITSVLEPAAQTQLFGRESLTGAVLGGVLGGVIGHNSGRRTAEGAAIGAGAGLLLGAVVGQERREQGYVATQVPVPPSPPPVYYAPVSPRPNYAVTATVLGGVAGGVIGHNSHRRTAEGVAIGAGAGLLLGAAAEQNARRSERIVYAQPTPVYTASAVVDPTPPPAAGPAAQPAPVHPASPEAAQPTSAARSVTIINNHHYYGAASPMAEANSLFGR
jgi:uncharacterized protein YcfJ